MLSLVSIELIPDYFLAIPFYFDLDLDLDFLSFAVVGGGVLRLMLEDLLSEMDFLFPSKFFSSSDTYGNLNPIISSLFCSVAIYP
jgi:hypothetical protein